MSQPTHEQVMTTEYVLIQMDSSVKVEALGVYKSEEEAYSEALFQFMQSIENIVNTQRSKTISPEKQQSIMDICRHIKQDISSYKERFEYMTIQSDTLFKDLCHDVFKVLPVKINKNESLLNESLFKTKMRNFLDVFSSKTDEEEDLGNSDDEEEDDEEEEEEEDEDLDEEDDEDEEVNLEDEEEEDDDAPTSENVNTQLEHSSEEEEQLDEDDEEEEEETENTKSLKRNESIEEEEDEIDEDELDDDEETNNNNSKKRRIHISKN